MGVVLCSKCETRTFLNCFVSLGESSGFCFNCVQSPFAFCEVCAVSFATECLARVVAVNSLTFTNKSFVYKYRLSLQNCKTYNSPVRFEFIIYWCTFGIVEI